MSAPKTGAILKQEQKAYLELVGRHTEGLVSPTGDVTEHFCPPPDNGAENGPSFGDVPLAWINGAPRVRKKYEDLGYVLLKDMCKADGCPEVHEEYKAAIFNRIVHRMPIRGDIGALYPPSVHRLRQLAREGGNAEGKAFVVGQGVVDDPAAKRKDLVASTLASVGVGDPRITTEPTKKGKAKAEETADA